MFGGFYIGMRRLLTRGDELKTDRGSLQFQTDTEATFQAKHYH